jgi:hypothetical protein
MLIRRPVTWVLKTTVTVVRRLVVHLAVALVCRLVLLARQNQMVGDELVRSGMVVALIPAVGKHPYPSVGNVAYLALRDKLLRLFRSA